MTVTPCWKVSVSGGASQQIEYSHAGLWQKINAYWRAADISQSARFISDNPLLKRPLKLSDVSRWSLNTGAQRLARLSMCIESGH